MAWSARRYGGGVSSMHEENKKDASFVHTEFDWLSPILKFSSFWEVQSRDCILRIIIKLWVLELHVCVLNKLQIDIWLFWYHTAWIWIWMTKGPGITSDGNFSSYLICKSWYNHFHFLPAEMEMILFIHFYPPLYPPLGRSQRHFMSKGH